MLIGASLVMALTEDEMFDVISFYGTSGPNVPESSEYCSSVAE